MAPLGHVAVSVVAERRRAGPPGARPLQVAMAGYAFGPRTGGDRETA